MSEKDEFDLDGSRPPASFSQSVEQNPADEEPASQKPARQKPAYNSSNDIAGTSQVEAIALAAGIQEG